MVGAGPMAQWLGSHAPLRQPGSCPGCGHGTTRWDMLGRHPTWHNQKDLQLKYTAVYWVGGLWREEGEKKIDYWQYMLAQVPILKKNVHGAGLVVQQLSVYVLLQ